MQRQNERIGHWISVEVLQGPTEGLERALEGLVLDTYQVTADTVGGVWITRALRAVPVLEEVRLASHAVVTDATAKLLTQALPGANKAQLRLASRVAVEMLYAAVEMLFDEALDARGVARTVAAMVAGHLDRLRPAKAPPRKRAAAPRK
jgi:hypothetical protein